MGVCKIDYVLRVTPVVCTEACAILFNEVVQKTLRSIGGGVHNMEIFKQLQLPTRVVLNDDAAALGLGLTSAGSTSASAVFSICRVLQFSCEKCARRGNIQQSFYGWSSARRIPNWGQAERESDGVTVSSPWSCMTSETTNWHSTTTNCFDCVHSFLLRCLVLASYIYWDFGTALTGSRVREFTLVSSAWFHAEDAKSCQQ